MWCSSVLVAASHPLQHHDKRDPAFNFFLSNTQAYQEDVLSRKSIIPETNGGDEGTQESFLHLIQGSTLTLKGRFTVQWVEHLLCMQKVHSLLYFQLGQGKKKILPENLGELCQPVWTILRPIKPAARLHRRLQFPVNPGLGQIKP